MGKLIIHNKSDLDDTEALSLVARVMDEGRVSGKVHRPQYCYCTTFGCLGKGEYAVWASLNQRSDKFIVEKL